MLEVLVLLEHGRFVDVVVGGEAVCVRVFGELADVFMIVAAADLGQRSNRNREGCAAV